MGVMKKCYKEPRMTGISYKEQKEGRLTGLVTSCVPSDGKTRKKKTQAATG
jgi:hypothetical protein